MTTLSPEEWAILSPEQRAEHKRAELLNVFGHDVKFDRQGRPIEQGLGSESNPTVQSFAALERAEGKAAADAMRARINKKLGVERF
jgi:hypothetical protein